MRIACRMFFSSKRPVGNEIRPSLNSKNSAVNRMIQMRLDMDKHLKQEGEKAKDLEQVFIGHSDIAIYLYLYMKHDCYKCQMADAILNHYQVSYQRIQNIMILDEIKKSKYFPISDYDWPLLRVNASLDEPLFLHGVDEIANYVIANGLTVNPRHYQKHDSWSLQGYQFVAESIKPHLDLLFLNPFLTWENVFRAPIEVFKKDGKGSRTPQYVMKLIRKGTWESIGNLYKLIQRRAEFSEAKAKFQQGIEIFSGRLQGKDYHGGTVPDEADFLLYGVLKAKHNSRTFQSYIEKQFPSALYSWFIRMQMNCRYVEDRFYSS